MNTFLCFTIATVAVAGLSACATTDRMTAAPHGGTEQAAGSKHRSDAEYISAVEHIARRRGILVQWVHPPVRRVEAPDR